MYKRILTISLLVIFVSIANAVTPSFRFIGDFWYDPFFYEPQYNMYSDAFNGSIMGGVKIDKFTIGLEIQNNYFSVTGQNTTNNLIGAWNITRASLLMYYKPVKWFELRTGMGGALLLSSFNYNNTGFISYVQGGLSFTLDNTFFPPWKYLSIAVVNRFDLFFPNNDSSIHAQYNNQLLPYYYGGIRLNFHPYFDWISLYIECGGMPWVYNSYPVSVKTGMFVWGAGISIDMTFPDLAKQLSKKRILYIEMHNEMRENNISKRNALIIDKIKTAKKGDTITFSNIIFYPDSDKIKEDSFPVLDTIASVLLKHPKIEIEIIGYTNSVGLPEEELKLSVNRAVQVAQYLSRHGIATQRMRVAGRGGITTQDKNIDEANRRVEILILKTSSK